MTWRHMDMVMEQGPTRQSDYCVLMTMAKHADDSNACWPSIATLARLSRMGERATQGAVKRLKDAGWVEISAGGGRRNCNQYTIKTPQQMHPLEDVETPQQTTQTPHMDTQTPQQTTLNPAADAPEPIRTDKEPIKEKVRARPRVKTDPSILPSFIRPEVAIAFIEMRNRKRAPLEGRALKLVTKNLNQLRDMGIDPNDAIDLAIENNWTSPSPKYRGIQELKGSTNERPNAPHLYAISSRKECAQRDEGERLQRIIKTAAAGTSREGWG